MPAPQKVPAPEPMWVENTAGPAAEFHDRPLPRAPTDTQLALWVRQIPAPALVLGSSQPDDIIDQSSARAAGWEVCRRRSGGGLVVVDPNSSLWVDIVVPHSHPCWNSDVGTASHWIGRAYATALSRWTKTSSGQEPQVHTGGWTNRDLGKVLCFAGLGPGEVTVGDHKVVGISQRRNRFAARFQTLCIHQSLDWGSPARVGHSLTRYEKSATKVQNPETAVALFGSPALKSAHARQGQIGWPTDLPEPPRDDLLNQLIAAIGQASQPQSQSPRQ